MVITADGKRAGATEQLAAFTRLLGISLIVACHPVTLGRALTRRAEQRAGAGRYAGLRSVRPRPDGGTDRAGRDRRRAPWCWCCPPASTLPKPPTRRSAYVAAGARLLVATRLDLARRLGGILAAAGSAAGADRGRHRPRRGGRPAADHPRVARRAPADGSRRT